MIPFQQLVVTGKMQEQQFRETFNSISDDELQEEVYILENIRLSTDFYEYILTDPAKYLSIIHFFEKENLEDKFKIYVSFSGETGNMTIVYMFNDNIYCSSSILDITGNDHIMDTFVEQVQTMLDEYRQLMINRENDRIKKIEERLHNNSICWYDAYTKPAMENKETCNVCNNENNNTNNFSKTCYRCTTWCMIGVLCSLVLTGIKICIH